MSIFSNMTPRGAIISLVSAALCVIGVVFALSSWVHLDAREIMVIQKPITGELVVITEPGDYWQGLSTVTKYRRREQYGFSAPKAGEQTPDMSIKTGFNDGGSGNISGVVSWEMPLTPDAVIKLHKEYGSFSAIDQQLIRPMLEKVIFSAGATMSSIESSSERRSEIPQTIDDQLQFGPYLTKVTVVNTTDALTKQNKSVKVTQLETDKDGKIVRASKSTIREYGISLSPVTINAIDYSKEVQLQIAERQKSTQAVQLSQAAAIRATQDTITTTQQGIADAAKAEWAQKTINAKEIAQAEKNKQVATLDALTAEQTKRRLILEGEGEAAKKRLIMAADGALNQKLDAYVKVQSFWAEAFKEHTGAMVPSVMMGGSGAGISGSGINATQQMMELLSVKAAKDLGLELQTTGANATGGHTSK